jgi:glycine oxidase
VAVIGGGAVGLSVAWRARRRGLSVVVLDRGPLGGQTTHVAAGMLAPITEADAGERALLALGMRSARQWAAFADELADASGHDTGYLACGTLVVARDRDEAEALERELALRRQLGLRVERLRASEARQREPGLAPGVRLALDVPDDHAVDPRALATALAVACERAGVVLRPRVTVDGIARDGVTLTCGERVAAQRVVVAAGPWSAGFGRVPVRPVKGQSLRLRDVNGPGLTERVIRFEGGYLVPRGDGRYVLGATVEERGFDRTVTAGGLYELLRDATELVPGVSELVVEETIAGLRPGTPDNAPVLGPDPDREHVVWATGHYRNGILLSPVTADLVAGLLAGERGVEEELQPFSPGRFDGGRAGAEMAA